MRQKPVSPNQQVQFLRTRTWAILMHHQARWLFIIIPHLMLRFKQFTADLLFLNVALLSKDRQFRQRVLYQIGKLQRLSLKLPLSECVPVYLQVFRKFFVLFWIADLGTPATIVTHIHLHRWCNRPSHLCKYEWTGLYGGFEGTRNENQYPSTTSCN